MKKNCLMAALTFLLALFFSSLVSAAGTTGAVYTMTNAPAAEGGNEIVVFARDAKGALSLRGTVATGGYGSGAGTGVGPDGALDPLGSQGSLVLSPDRKWLLAANAGSDNISVFRVGPDGLELAWTEPSGGSFPVSITIFHDLVYVLNADLLNVAEPNIAGFKLNHTGELMPLIGSARTLPPGVYAQVGFSPRGTELVLTEKGNHGIFVFPVMRDGLPGPSAEMTMANGLVPFGFVFDPRSHLLVSEAGSGAASSYSVLDDLTLEVITASEPNNQAATCWIAATERLAFTANTGSNTLSAYAIQPGQGSLSIIDEQAGEGDLPLDLDVTTNGRFLYVLNAGDESIGMFRITSKGNLIDLGRTSAAEHLELYAQGMAVW